MIIKSLDKLRVMLMMQNYCTLQRLQIYTAANLAKVPISCPLDELMFDYI